MRKAIANLSHLHRQFTHPRGFVSTKMANLNINSNYKMLSGYEIPVLGYGVSRYFFILFALAMAEIGIYKTGLLEALQKANQTKC